VRLKKKENVFLMIWFATLISVGFLWNSTAHTAPPQPERLEAKILSALQEGRYFDGQTLSLVGTAIYEPEVKWSGRFEFLRAYSLWKLGDSSEALRILNSLSLQKNLSAEFVHKVDFLEHWIYLQSKDRPNFEKWLGQSTHDVRARGHFYLAMMENSKSKESLARDLLELPVSAERRSSLQVALDDLDVMKLQSPTTNAILSGILPGLGHARLGRWQDAALTFALNAISIGATAELARKDLVMPAIAAGTFASLFYVGGISSAWRATRERNDQERAKSLKNAEEQLFPELQLKF
jgi:hypothetical protein